VSRGKFVLSLEGANSGTDSVENIRQNFVEVTGGWKTGGTLLSSLERDECIVLVIEDEGFHQVMQGSGGLLLFSVGNDVLNSTYAEDVNQVVACCYLRHVFTVFAIISIPNCSMGLQRPILAFGQEKSFIPGQFSRML
jgi:hypothetical protein